MGNFWTISATGTTDQTSGWKPVRGDGVTAQDTILIQGAYTVLGTPNGVMSLKATLDSAIAKLQTEVGTVAINASSGSFEFKLTENAYNEFKLDLDVNDLSTRSMLIFDNFSKGI
jgi:hypothetical protein